MGTLLLTVYFCIFEIFGYYGTIGVSYTDCFTWLDVQKVAYDGTQTDIVTSCASINNNYVPFTLCNNYESPGNNSIIKADIAANSRIFIGLTDGYHTNNYQWMSDGTSSLSWESKSPLILQNDNDTNKACVVMTATTNGKKTWIKHNTDTSQYLVCEILGNNCRNNYVKKAIPNSIKSLCYKSTQTTSPKYRDDECSTFVGKVAPFSKYSSYLEEISEEITKSTNDSEIRFSLAEGTYSYSYEKNVTFERVPCSFRSGDYFYCMKPKPNFKEKTSYHGCYSLPKDEAKMNLSFTSIHMQIRFCVSHCRGLKKSYSGIRDQECYCLDSPFPSSLPESSDICHFSCPGHPSQTCGGSNSISVYNNGYFKSFSSSCGDYYKFGFYPPPGKPLPIELRNGSSTCSVEKMFPSTTVDVVCPEGFFRSNQTCFYFDAVNSVKSNEAQRLCHLRQADLASINNSVDLKFIQMTVRQPYSFSKLDSWYLGAYYSSSNRLWIWRDGTSFRHFISPTNKYDPACLRYNLRKGHLLTETIEVEDCNSTSNIGFVCKHNPTFIGFKPMMEKSLKISFKSSTMTVTTCVQLCLSSKPQFAQVLNDKCSCYSDADETSHYFNCSEPIACPGNAGQICGCDSNNASTYSTDIHATPRYKNCSDLKINGVSTNGIYFTDNVTEFCNFLVEPNCSSLSNDYISYRGNCYCLFSKDNQTALDAQNSCWAQSSILAVPTDEDQLNFLNHLILKYSTQRSHWIGVSRNYETVAPESSMEINGSCRLLKNGKIHFESCGSSLYPFICQHENFPRIYITNCGMIESNKILQNLK
ncbi:hypothetical protein CHUAL_002321 [Chamberlinius hualienensis]